MKGKGIYRRAIRHLMVYSLLSVSLANTRDVGLQFLRNFIRNLGLQRNGHFAAQRTVPLKTVAAVG